MGFILKALFKLLVLIILVSLSTKIPLIHTIQTNSNIILYSYVNNNYI